MKSKKISLKDYWYAKPEDERLQKFLKKHPIDRVDDANGNGDDVFNGSNIKTYDREKEHGYNPGSDAEVYEGKESKVKMDPDTKTPDVFTPALRKKRGLPESANAHINEAVAGLDEISKKTLQSYLDKSGHRSTDPRMKGLQTYAADMGDENPKSKTAKFDKKVRNSRSLAQAKIKVRVPASESVEIENVKPITELSSDTMMRYAKSARKQMSKPSASDETVGKRVQGLNMAIKKNKEERAKPQYEAVEQIDELSKKTLGSYIKKATYDKRRLEDEEERLRKASGDMQDHSYSRSVNKVKQPGEKSSHEVVQHAAAILQKAARKADDKAHNRKMGIHSAMRRLTKEGTMNLTDYINHKLDEGQLDELSKETLLSYQAKNKSDPSREVKKGKVPVAKAARRARRDSGMATAKEKLSRIVQKEYEVKEKKRMTELHEIHDHFHKEAPKILAKHGYTKLSSGENHDVYHKVHDTHGGHVSMVALHKKAPEDAWGAAARHRLTDTTGWSSLRIERRSHRDSVHDAKNAATHSLERSIMDHEKHHKEWYRD